MGRYPISLASTAIAKKPLFGIAIAKGSVNGPLVLVRQKWVEKFAKEWVPFLAMPANANPPCERTLTNCSAVQYLTITF